MAPKAPTTPKAKPTRATKGGIVKRTPTKATSASVSPTKATATKVSPVKATATKVFPVKATANKPAPGAPLDKDLVFLWKCVNMSSGIKIDWAAVSEDAGKSVGTVQKQYWRLNTKVEKYLAATAPADAADGSDNENDTNEKDVQTADSNETE
ncbi:hypothetical protein N7517_003434 [Penicillium concentricum]|uniref:Myb-like DNA-binding domain-containing protein n=1 Tax=Penicillium concentricum TaxID=293559 RepID=A0A9W9VLW3_9EURO|nr:uncharacterized protein N7517_003434 [Penicillium concentricum]KAJ5385523.1 hypothetical protein N7517_003434 [Penicillium concentricum]